MWSFRNEGQKKMEERNWREKKEEEEDDDDDDEDIWYLRSMRIGCTYLNDPSLATNKKNSGNLKDHSLRLKISMSV